MKKNHSLKKKRRAPKAILRLPDLDHAKAAVLNSLTCPDAQRGYRHAIDEFIDWYCSEPRLAFNKTVVLRYRIHLDSESWLRERSTSVSGRCAAWLMKRLTAVCSAPIWRRASAE